MGFDELRSAALPSEQVALLKGQNTGGRLLGIAGVLSNWRVLELAVQPVLAFVFTLLLLTTVNFRYENERLLVCLYYLGLLAVLVTPVLGAGLLLLNVAASSERVRPPNVVFSAWWPFWRLVLCAGAAFAGSSIGNHLWYEQFFPHTRMERLQAYNNVDPREVGGKRLQDAGVVGFNDSAGVDRTRSGCLKDGATYCVAPIVAGGELAAAASAVLGTIPTQDLFMSGMDCCDCPGEFRCGDWDVPMPLGGFRVFDAARHGYYRLAAEEWAATHQKSLGQPIFFEWTADPVRAFNELHAKGMRLKVSALLICPVLVVLTTVVLNSVLGMLCRSGWATPIETFPALAPGLGRAMSSRFLRQTKEQQEAYDAKYVIL